MKGLKMFPAHSFVLRTHDTNVKFNICIDNEWFDQVNAEEAFKILQNMKLSKDARLANDDNFEPWVPEVMDWSISTVDENTIVMNVM